MNAQPAPYVPIDRQTWERLIAGVKSFATSEVGGRAKWLFGALIVLMFGINGMNVVSSYVGRDFFTSIEHRNMQGFIGWAFVYVGVFAALSFAGVIFRYCEERLGLLWREWLTRTLVERYLGARVYYRLDTSGDIANPDQRITDDVRAFTVTTLSFVLLLLNASFTVLAFSGVLWSISPLLFMVAVLYAAAGSYLTIVLGRPLVGLNYNQLDKEANFRADLIHVRENAESVALLHREFRLRTRLMSHLDALVANFQEIISINRNLGFFTTGYNYLIQIIPALMVAPLFIRGEVEFGVIAQSAMAFTMLLGAFSLIVTNFQSISAFAAVITRIGSLQEAVGRATTAPTPPCGRIAGPEPEGVVAPPTAIHLCEEPDRLAYENLTLYSPQDGRVLVQSLSISIPAGCRLLILGANDAAKVALLRVTAGIWEYGEGRIVRPPLQNIFFLPERPYMPPGTLRELLVRTGREGITPDRDLLDMLRTLDLESVLTRAGGLDIERDWDDLLSLAEQQLIAFGRLLLARPGFVVLDRVGTALNPEDLNALLGKLGEYGINYVTIGRNRHGRRESDERLENYDALLELELDGQWRWWDVQDGRIIDPHAHPAY
jgi:putative ATP-binding cassette transporter